MKKKIMFMFVTLFGILLLIPYGVSAVSVYPEVSNNTNADSLVKDGDIVVEGSGTNSITVTVNAGTFKLLDTTTQVGASGPGEERPANHAWIGLRFKFGNSVHKVEIGPEGGTFDSKKTEFNTNDFTEYFGIDVNSLRTAATIKTDFKKVAIAKWNDGQARELTITIIVKPENITLYQQGSNNIEEWNEANYLTASNQVKLTYHLLIGKDTKEETIYWDKSTPLTSKNVESFVKKENAKYSVVGVYTTAEKNAKFELEKTLSNDTEIFIEVSFPKTTEKVPSTVDYLTTYIALGAVTLILSFGAILFLSKENN